MSGDLKVGDRVKIKAPFGAINGAKGTVVRFTESDYFPVMVKLDSFPLAEPFSLEDLEVA